MPPKKKFAINQEHGFIGDKPKSNAKPKPFIESPEIIEYKRKRDRHLYRIHLANNDTTAINFLKEKYNF